METHELKTIIIHMLSQVFHFKYTPTSSEENDELFNNLENPKSAKREIPKDLNFISINKLLVE